MDSRKHKNRIPAPPAPADRCPSRGGQQVVLVLQGGGALGAYQAGVYEALHESGFEPDWVIGTSIGAINGALIAGNAPERRVERLRAFWDAVAHRIPDVWAALPGFAPLCSRWSAVAQGLPGFFEPHHAAWLGAHFALPEDGAGYYQTQALRDTLARLVDTERLGRGLPRLTVGAVNVRSAEMRYFDSRDEALDLLHVLASGALPPAFPAVRIGGELYWDGGIYSNTPIEAVLDDNPRRDSLVFAVQLWRAAGDAPRSMWQVTGRQKDIQYASRVDSHLRRQAQIHRLRHVVRELARELPREALERAEVRELASYGCGTVMHVVRLLAPRLAGEDHTSDVDFSVSTLRARWQAGLHAGRRAIARRPWLAPAGHADGVVVHDMDGSADAAAGPEAPGQGTALVRSLAG